MRLLEGFKVLEVAQMQQAPAAAGILADLGASVIKVEEPKVGDMQRGWRSVLGVSMEITPGRNAVFEAINRNKRGITLNLRHPEGGKVFRDLVATSDVLITNYRKSAREMLGFDYPSVSAHNPRLVYGVASAYGEEGASGDERAFDNVVFARSGWMYCVGEESESPAYMTPGVGDQLGGVMLALGVVAALLRRSQTGEGDEIRTSELGSLTHLLTLPLSLELLTGDSPSRPTRAHLFSPLVGWYRCADDRWLMLSLNRPQQVWRTFCEILGLGAEVAHSTKYSSTAARAENAVELTALLDRAFLAKSREEWIAALRSAGLICSPVNAIDDLVHDPQITENGYIVDLDHPTLGKVKMLGSPIASRSGAFEVRNGAPELGQHTEEVLQELGYSWERIVELGDRGVI